MMVLPKQIVESMYIDVPSPEYTGLLQSRCEALHIEFTESVKMENVNEFQLKGLSDVTFQKAQGYDTNYLTYVAASSATKEMLLKDTPTWKIFIEEHFPNLYENESCGVPGFYYSDFRLVLDLLNSYNFKPLDAVSLPKTPFCKDFIQLMKGREPSVRTKYIALTRADSSYWAELDATSTIFPWKVLQDDSEPCIVNPDNGTCRFDSIKQILQTVQKYSTDKNVYYVRLSVGYKGLSAGYYPIPQILDILDDSERNAPITMLSSAFALARRLFKTVHVDSQYVADTVTRLDDVVVTRMYQEWDKEQTFLTRALKEGNGE